MREIKFRAWDKEFNIMHYPEDWDNEYMTSSGEVVEKVERTVLYNHTEVIMEVISNERVLMQYTGLKDKNGREIYEGDIVNYEDGEDSFSAIVEWANYGYYFEVEKPFRDSFSLDDWYDNGSLDVEVIGSIHEKPELLEST